MNIVFCGKGGVGKSTISSIYAMEFSKDKKTLIISIDQDHSLSIIFNKEIGNEIKEIKKNLYAIELDAQKIANNYINEVLENLESILNKKAFESVKNYSKFLLNSNIALNTAIIYGIYKIPKDFDIIIIDTPPSHQFISFLTTLFNLPKNLEIILKIYENWKNILENWADKNLKNYESLKQKHEIALNVQNFFKNSYYYIIINPQKVVIEISYKLEEFLKSYKLNIKGIILNKFKHIL
ncbi:MAG: ArsA-related P-loop ATPase [candidate division WOR-3 bacterium]